MRIPSWLSLRRSASKPTGDDDYRKRVEEEIRTFATNIRVHDLPDIFHYWSNKYLGPRFSALGFANNQEFFSDHLIRACSSSPDRERRFVSVGAGNAEVDVLIVERLILKGVRNFTFECLDINPAMLERARAAAVGKNVAGNMEFTECDLNSWNPPREYDAVLAIQCLHHFVELESLFDKIRIHMADDGYFLTDDIIGRNGHMRWPEALSVVEELWRQLPDRYKYNHLLQRLDLQFVNFDCSSEGFEGVRAQDILGLLVERFHFEWFAAWGNLIDPFVDRAFGHNFDAADQGDRQFIDRVQHLDDTYIENGRITPTHMTAAMKKHPTTLKCYKHLTPRFCFRNA